jgi:hypothetical protein
MKDANLIYSWGINLQNLKDYVPDQNLDALYKYILPFVGEEEWRLRKEKIESHFRAADISGASSARFQTTRFNFLDDQFGWFFYLLESTLYRPINVEANQQARILPIFTRISDDLELLKSLKNVNKQFEKLVLSSQPDSELFEILVALVWARNGCSEVEFLQPHKRHKLHDIRAIQRGEIWAIEAKRMTLSGYSLAEREKWLVLWRPVQELLLTQKLPFILEVTFHKELKVYEDDFLIAAVADKLKFVAGPCTLIDTPSLTLRVRFVDFEKIDSHLNSWHVKVPSRQLDELITGEKQVSGRGTTHVIEAKFVKRGGSGFFNDYIEDLNWAAGAVWSVDAERSYQMKARDIRRQLSDANSQLPNGTPGAIHVGLETYDGVLVEEERFNRIFNTALQFDPQGKDLRFMFCHLYQSYSTFVKPWEFDETVYYFGVDQNCPIPQNTTISPFEIVEEGVHWLKPAP